MSKPREFAREAGTLVPGLETLDRVRAWVQEAAASGPGGICPCCDGLVKIYRTKPVGLSVLSLRNLVGIWRARLQPHMGRSRASGNITPSPYDLYVHLEEFQAKARDSNFAALARWGLVKAAPNDDDTKRSSGLWQPTRLGLDFVDGNATIQRYVVTLNNRVLGFDGPEVGIQDLLADRFD